MKNILLYLIISRDDWELYIFTLAGMIAVTAAMKLFVYYLRGDFDDEDEDDDDSDQQNLIND